MWTKVLKVIALVAVCGCCQGCHKPSAPPSPANQTPLTSDDHPMERGVAQPLSAADRPDWTSPESEEELLGPAYQFSGFEIRPPASFRFIKHSPETHSYLWVGPIREDETYAQLTIVAAEIPSAQTNISHSEILRDVIAGIKRHREDWFETEPETGKVNGITTMRTSFHGVVAAGARKGLVGRTMHGIGYLAVHGNQSIFILCQDVEPEQAESLKVGMAAALSFRLAPE